VARGAATFAEQTRAETACGGEAGFRALLPLPRKKTIAKAIVFFQLNPPLAEEIHLRWMKSLRDEIRLRRDGGGGFNFI
jgi:hypothetical protein